MGSDNHTVRYNVEAPPTRGTRSYSGTLAEIARRIMAELPGLGPVRRGVLHSAISMLINEFDKRKLLREEASGRSIAASIHAPASRNIT